MKLAWNRITKKIHWKMIHNSISRAGHSDFPPSLQAMLFHWAPSHPLKPGGTLSKPLPTLSYWVCGRVIRNPLSSASSSPGATPFKEFYVAYHQSAPQNMVELAFRLAFGIHMWPVRKNNQRNIFTQVLVIQIDLDLDSTTNGALFHILVRLF